MSFNHDTEVNLATQMMQDIVENCQYCSQISKLSGEDPAGTASTADHWLIFELPQPWRKEMFTNDPLIAQLIPLIKKLFIWRGILVRPIAIAPDRTYSEPHLTRVIHYWRPQKSFAQYSKLEYLIPKENKDEFAIALLHHLSGKKNKLYQFEQYLQPTQQIRDLFICTHTQVDLACGRFGTPLYRQLRKNYAQQDQLRIWQSTHFGGHQFAPTLLDLPIGQFWGHLEADIADLLISKQGSLEQLRPYYRGWAGMNKYEQIAEREIWMQVGWEWQNYPKRGRIKKKGLRGLKKFVYPIFKNIPIKILQLWLERWTQEANWIEVEIKYAHPLTLKNGCYVVKVMKTKIINSAKQSASSKQDKVEMVPTPQYTTNQIVEVQQ